MSRSLAAPACLDFLESRLLFAATPQIDFSDFASTTHLVANGFGGSSITSGNQIRMTTDLHHQARSVWFDTAVPVGQFSTNFSFQSKADAHSADGLTFTVQNGPTSSLGRDGRDLGYGGIGSSVAVAFDLFNFAAFGSEFGFVKNGDEPQTDTDMSPLDLHNGDVFNATVTYDGTNLKVKVTDDSDPSKTFSASEAIDIPGLIGSDTAIVGFTAATGD
ncbi:MAG TPA: L-type lectin-domain containing protein, partial [Tepidisphaeraceae bacterium]